MVQRYLQHQQRGLTETIPKSTLHHSLFPPDIGIRKFFKASAHICIKTEGENFGGLYNFLGGSAVFRLSKASFRVQQTFDHISEYVQVDVPGEGIVPSRQFDISKIDFDLLRREFARAKKKNLILKDLDDLIQQRLNDLLFSNPQRINYYERYQQIIEDYNSEQNRATIEKTFMDLMDLANSMDQEEQRYVREGFSSDEELSLYDLLFSENLSKQDIQKIKQVAVDLLAKVKAKIAELDHWTDKQETKAAVDNLIRDTLWAELPECYDEVSISGYRQRIYEYVYTRYPDVA